MVYHFSAGVGRTGTYIVVDAMLERAKKQKNVDIYNYIHVVRKGRIHMVQTEVKYSDGGLQEVNHLLLNGGGGCCTPQLLFLSFNVFAFNALKTYLQFTRL